MPLLFDAAWYTIVISAGRGATDISHNPFPYTLDNKRYHTWNYYLKNTFGGKIGKVALDAGFTCPNIDGSKGVGGCTYCSPRGSGDFAGNPLLGIPEQYRQQQELMLQKWPQAGSIAYFQAHSNTYAPLPVLREKYEQALACPGVKGLCIATRADLLEENVVEYLAQLSKRTWLLVELGLQTIHDETAERINRCHNYRTFLEGYSRLRQEGIAACIHIINYLPGEDPAMMLATAEAVAQLRPQSVKIHMLHILQGTALAEQYKAGAVSLPGMEEYVSLVCDQLERLPPEIVVQRLTGDGKAEDLLAPQWVLYKRRVLNGIDKELARRNTWQGRLAHGGSQSI